MYVVCDSYGFNFEANRSLPCNVVRLVLKQKSQTGHGGRRRRAGAISFAFDDQVLGYRGGGVLSRAGGSVSDACDDAVGSE